MAWTNGTTSSTRCSRTRRLPNIEFDDDDEGCVWNIRVDWQNYDESVLWKNVNLCKFNALRLRYDSGTKTTSFIAE